MFGFYYDPERLGLVKQVTSLLSLWVGTFVIPEQHEKGT